MPNETPIERIGPATLLVCALAAIVVIAGAVVTIIDQDTLPFDDYVKTLAGVAGAGGLLGIGRGILAGAKQPGGFGPSPKDVLQAELTEREPPAATVNPAVVDPGTAGTTLHKPGGKKR